MINEWLQVTINPHQVAHGLHKNLERALSNVHLANDQPLFSLGLVESILRPDDGSRVYFLTPGSAKYLHDDLKAFRCCPTSAPKACEVRAVGVTFSSWSLLGSSE